MKELFHKHVLSPIESSEIFHTKFFSEDFAGRLYELFSNHSEWTTKRFAYSTHEVQLEKFFPDLYSIIKRKNRRHRKKGPRSWQGVVLL